MDVAATRIEAFHRAQMPTDLRVNDAAGLTLGMRWTALDAVGIYVPGGKAAYPSSVLMGAIPARIAAVERIAMCVPSPHGALNPLVLAAAHRAGVTEVYRLGGAQAIAALAYGTASIPAVDRVVGPGNAYVAEAKRQVFGQVGIDSIAGPSEVVVLADATQNPRCIAIDLLAQAEHDEAAQAILITDDAGFADAVAHALAAELPTLARAAIAGASWREHGAIILVGNWDEAAALVDRLAPEHLQIMTADPSGLFSRIRHAGAAFLGRHCPEALGDYVAGPNHVLPTGRNLFTADPRTLPTPTAMELGRLAADEVVRAHLQTHGDMPRAVVVDLWGSATLRTGGEVNASNRRSRQSAYCRDASTPASSSPARTAGSSISLALM